jgi:hypothetical protein
MLFKNSVRTSKRTPHFTITKINWLTLFKFKCFFITLGSRHDTSLHPDYEDTTQYVERWTQKLYHNFKCTQNFVWAAERRRSYGGPSPIWEDNFCNWFGFAPGYEPVLRSYDHGNRLNQWYSTEGTRRHLRGYVDYTICITCIMYQQLWGYKVEDKLYLGIREHKRLNTADLNLPAS